MKGLKYFVCITRKDNAEGYTEFFKSFGSNNVLINFGQGSAPASKLDLLGIVDNGKAVFQLMVRNTVYKEFCEGLDKDLHLDENHSGLGFFVPVDGIGGESGKRFFVGNDPIENKEEEVNMSEQSKCVAIISIMDKGNADAVMESAREAGATGGTIVKAKGTGAELAKFFGISISEEKEMLYIIAKREKRDDIMYAIMDKAGPNTDAHGIVFSLPVDKVVGIKDFEKLYD